MSGSAAVVVVGGGVYGCGVAYHLRQAGLRERIVVLERDPSYRRASSRLAFGGIRQQFCSAVNVALARRSVAFYRRFDEAMAVDGRRAAARLRQHGYLFLADADNAARLDRRFGLMRAAGASVDRLTPAEAMRLAPDLDLSDVAFALFGPEDGYADPQAVLAGFRARCESLGVEFVADELARIEPASSAIDARVAAVVCRSGARIATERVVCAAGAFSAAIGEAAGVEIPVRPVRQQLVRCELPRPWPYEFPVVVDPSGVHWRSAEASTIVVARTENDEPPGERFEADADRFATRLRPVLVRRVPAFAALREVATWAGLYEMTDDHNGLVGFHPDRAGLYLACGFSGHGLMMAPAVGEVAAAEILGQTPPIDVDPLRPDRFRRGRRLDDEALI